MERMTNRTFGVELEFVSRDHGHEVKRQMSLRGLDCRIEGYNHVTKNHWKIVTDSSVRPNRKQSQNGYNYGLELVSPILKGENGLEQLKIATEALEAAEAKVNKSSGLHVHHGARDLNINSFKNVLRLYLRFENTLDSLVAPSRRGDHNTYCRSMVQATGTWEERKIDAARNLNELAPVYGGRFFKLNLHSFATHSTIEFRQHQGTIEFEKISNWIKLTQAIVERSHGRKVMKTTSGADNWKLFAEVLFLDRANNITKKSDYAKTVVSFFNKRIKKLAA